jgi:hypothetical protein
MWKKLVKKNVHKNHYEKWSVHTCNIRFSDTLCFVWNRLFKSKKWNETEKIRVYSDHLSGSLSYSFDIILHAFCTHTHTHTHTHIYITLFKLHETTFDGFDISFILFSKPSFLQSTSNHRNCMDNFVGLHSNCWALNLLHRWMIQQPGLPSLPLWFLVLAFPLFVFFCQMCLWITVRCEMAGFLLSLTLCGMFFWGWYNFAETWYLSIPQAVDTSAEPREASGTAALSSKVEIQFQVPNWPSRSRLKE